MNGITPIEMLIGFALMNAFILLFVYGVKEIITLKYEQKQLQETVKRSQSDALKELLARGEFNDPEYNDLRLYALNDQLAHGEISRPEYEELHHRIVH